MGDTTPEAHAHVDTRPSTLLNTYGGKKLHIPSSEEYTRFFNTKLITHTHTHTNIDTHALQYTIKHKGKLVSLFPKL